MIFMTKWLIKFTGNLIRPRASLGSVRMKLMIKCYWKLDKSLLHLISTVFVVSVFTVTAYSLFGSPSARWQARQILWSHRMQVWMVNSMPKIRLAPLAVVLAAHVNDFAIMMTSHCEVFWWMKYWQIALKTANSPNYNSCQNFQPYGILY